MITITVSDNFKYITLASDGKNVPKDVSSVPIKEYDVVKCAPSYGITWRRYSDGNSIMYYPLFYGNDMYYKCRYESNPYLLMKYIYYYTKYLTDLKIPYKLKNVNRYKFTTDGGKLHACYLRYRI